MDVQPKLKVVSFAICKDDPDAGDLMGEDVAGVSAARGSGAEMLYCVCRVRDMPNVTMKKNTTINIPLMISNVRREGDLDGARKGVDAGLLMDIRGFIIHILANLHLRVYSNNQNELPDN